MSTAAQQQANKENAQHSTGPRTAEGKQRSSQNAITEIGGDREIGDKALIQFFPQ